MRRTRRRFLAEASLAGFGTAVLAGRKGFALPAGASKPQPKAFELLPLGAVMPAGWLKAQLQTQADGLGGHLDETWADVGPNSGWLGGTGESWERGPYFLDGLYPLAVLLEDDKLKAKAQRYVDWMLTSQTPDGMFGPKTNDDWWPRMVALKVLAQYAEASGDPRVVPFMTKYFAYQQKALPGRPLRDWGKFRWQDNTLTVLWLYERTKDPSLLELAALLHSQGFDWQGQFVNFKYTQKMTRATLGLDQKEPEATANGLKDAALSTHGVNNAQALKASPVAWLLTGSPADRAGYGQQTAALDKYHGIPNGMFSADEHLAGPNPSQGIELCAVVEAMYSLEQSMAILGDPSIGDRLEKLAYNALPGTFSDDMWAHQYNQEPNQVECSLHHQPWTTDGPESNLYGLEPNFGCCAANFHQGWPKFTSSLWMGGRGGLVAAAYAPCSVKTKVAGVPVQVVEETEYPFRGTVKLTVSPEKPATFPLMVRVPAWAKGASIKVNGKPEPAPAPGTFATVKRTWKAGDVLELAFPMEPRSSRWYNDSVALERGPLVFSLPVGESWVKLRDRGMTADWQVFPSGAWNYAVAPGTAVAKESAVGTRPFAQTGAPVTMQIKARKLPKWQAEDGVAAAPPQSPVTSTEAEETLTLVPYAAAKLRITAFPALGEKQG